MEGTIQCPANYIPLTPISFLERAAVVYPDHTSVIYGSGRYTWRETRARCLRLASALSQLGISRRDVVAVLAPNVPAIYELHFGVPMAGAILCTLNVRHDASMLSVLLQHSETKIIFVDHQFIHIAKEAISVLSQQHLRRPLLVEIAESGEMLPMVSNLVDSSYIEYENLLDMGKLPFEIRWPIDECDPISLNYTSGTTASPKGVIYSHRGSYLNAISTVLLNDMTTMPVYLWTVPMFHCNGWCLPWGISAQGGTNICIRNVTAKVIFDSIAAHKVTHIGGAPTVLNMIANAPTAEQKPLPGRVTIMTGAAPPPPQILFKMEEFGFHVIHSYGLTETYGPATVCTWNPEWNSLPALERAKLKSRQGLHHLGMEEVDVKNPTTLESVPADGKTMGEVMFRGNTVMNGYYKDLKATKEALADGWFRTGDLAVRHKDGYIKIKDRSKDIIISGGENISTVELEAVIFSHPKVLEAAVVGRPDEYWGETPCAFLKLKEGSHVDAKDIIQFCRSRLPHYMAPRTVIFSDLPKTSTGKIQKYILRRRAKAMGSLTEKNRSKL